MRDFYPEELRLRSWLFEHWRTQALEFGFVEYDACVLEHEALYQRKAGEEIAEQIYGFADKSGRRLALRPEMTPSLARLVLQRRNTLQFPLKWFSIPQCFRYERMARGRRREHFQWNADIVGQGGVWAEAELLCLLLSTLRALGLEASQVCVRVNHRGLLAAALARAGVPPERTQPVLVALDKRDKLSAAALQTQLAAAGLDTAQTERLLALLHAETLEAAEALLDGGAAAEHLRTLLGLVEQAGFGGWLRFDASVVRGLAYYTGVVFEARDTKNALRAICGGGRYDSLLDTLGGQATPAAGFGFGDAVILELLQALGRLPHSTPELDDVVIPLAPEGGAAALRVAMALRAQGRRVSVDFRFRRLKRSLGHAAEQGAARAVLLLPDELAQGQAVLRDLQTQQETRIPLNSLCPEGK